MAVLGTKKFWRPVTGSSVVERDSQILKNAGYLNIRLSSVNYMARGNFWQNIFGGTDNVALATNLRYQSGTTVIEATAVQDIRQVKANVNSNWGLDRHIAVMIPATADAIALEVKMTAVKNDQLQAKFDMLNKPEYQSALQLAPAMVGQVLTVTSLVKKLFTDSDPQSRLEAAYAGYISAAADDNPVAAGKLTTGTLIIISTDEGDSFSDADETKFEFRGDSLYYNNTAVENTYLVFRIGFDALKGEDQNSNWFGKYSAALSNLDKILVAAGTDDIAKIYNDSKMMWIEGNALLDADPTYINSERIKLKNAAIKQINDKYQTETTAAPAPPAASAGEILHTMSGSSSFHTVQTALPATGSFLQQALNPDPHALVGSFKIAGLSTHENQLSSLLNRDTESYLSALKLNNMTFNLSKK